MYCSFCSLTDSPSGYVPYQAKSPVLAPPSGQKQEVDFASSSEEQAGTESPSPPPPSAISPSSSSPLHQRTSLSSQDSRASSTADATQAPFNGIHRNPDGAATLAAVAAPVPIPHHHNPEPNADPNAAPPALPPKTRKAKVPEVPKDPEYSDRGDSDMDEETYSSSQEKLKLKKVRPG